MDDDSCPYCGFPYENFIEIDEGWECPGCLEKFIIPEDACDYDCDECDEVSRMCCGKE